MTPTQRTLADLRKLGYTAQVVEKYNHFCKRRIDLFGIVDIVAMRPGVGIVGVQATSGTNHSKRRTKSLAEPRLREWLMSGGKFELWSYEKQGARGKRKMFVLRREEILVEQLPTV